MPVPDFPLEHAEFERLAKVAPETNLSRTMDVRIPKENASSAGAMKAELEQHFKDWKADLKPNDPIKTKNIQIEVKVEVYEFVP